MIDARAIRDVARHFGSKRVLAANIALFSLCAWAFFGEFMRDRDARAEVSSLVAQGDAIAAKNEMLRSELTVSAAEVESEARLKLNLKLPGEEVVVVKGARQHALGGESTRAPVDDGGNAAKWWKLFFE